MATNQELSDLTPLPDGVRDLLSILFKIYFAKLVNHCLRRGIALHDAQDIASECFVKILRASPTFKNFTHARNYLYLVLNTCISDFRNRGIGRGDLTFPEEEPQNIDPDSETFFDAVERKAANEALLLAIATLPPQAQKVMRLRIEEGLQRSEIAMLMDITPDTVSSHIKESEKKLRKILNSMGYNTFIITWWLEIFLR
jgi:RNA polymerase sigma factor (sigma-70 family)